MPQYGTDRAALSATSLLGLAALSLCLIVGLYAFPRRRSATTAQVKEVVPAPITDVGSADGGGREEWQTPPSSPQRLSIRFSPAVERSFLRGDNGGPPADAAPPKRYGLHNEETEPADGGTIIHGGAEDPHAGGLVCSAPCWSTD